VREAKQTDKAPVLEFVSRIWGGHDYVPEVWDEWFGDRNGKVFVVEVDGTPVGMNRLRFLSGGIGWLEGVRVHPEFRGRGLAGLLGQHSMEFGRTLGLHTYRLATASRNFSAQRQVAKLGMKQVGRFRCFSMKRKPRFKDPGGVRAVASDEAEDAYSFVAKTTEYLNGNGFVWEAFTASKLDRGAFVGLVRKREVLEAIRPGGGRAVAVFKKTREGSESWGQIGFLCGDPQSARTLVRHLFKARPRALWDESIVFLPMKSKLIRTVRQMANWNTFQMLLFEKRVR
jgi:GNAT superfamily N-acetyltransferase